MTAQEAAHALLTERGKPETSRILAERMLRRGMIGSSASDPIQSLAQTIEKNIRGGVYNRPKLAFDHGPDGTRRIALAIRTTDSAQASGTEIPPRRLRIIPDDERAFVEVSARLLNKIALVTFAGLAPSPEAAAELVMSRGLDAMKNEIAEGMRRALATSSVD